MGKDLRSSSIWMYQNVCKSKLEREKHLTSSCVVQMAPSLKALGKQFQFRLYQCNAFLTADIPLLEYDEIEVRELFEKYFSKEAVLALSTSRQSYIHKDG